MKIKSQICKAAADLLSKAANFSDDYEVDDGLLIPIINDIKNAEIGVDIILRNMKDD